MTTKTPEAHDATPATAAVGAQVDRPVGRLEPERRADGMPTSADERKLRRMYAVRVGMPTLYMDDGEGDEQQATASLPASFRA